MGGGYKEFSIEEIHKRPDKGWKEMAAKDLFITITMLRPSGK